MPQEEEGFGASLNGLFKFVFGVNKRYDDDVITLSCVTICFIIGDNALFSYSSVYGVLRSFGPPIFFWWFTYCVYVIDLQLFLSFGQRLHSADAAGFCR